MSLSKNVLIEYFFKGIKSQEDAKIGIEIESFLCKNNTLSPFTKSESLQLLDCLSSEGWQKVFEKEELKSLTSNYGNITFEPGFQIEFSSLPEKNLDILEHSYNFFLDTLKKSLSLCNCSAFALGHHPFLTPETTSFLENKRYSFMYNYMPEVGTLGRSMMKNTTTLQANIDYFNEDDLRKKIQVLANITPFLIYFSASSPFSNGKVTPFLSYRTHIWENTDKFRAGMPEFFFNNQFSIERYVDYLLNIPLYFVIKNNNYIYNENNYTFLDLMEYKVPGLEANLEDFILHVSTVFPDIRLKNYLEIRSCDTMGFNNVFSIPALLTGILYNTSSLEECYSLTKSWNKETFVSLKKHLNTKGLTNDTINGVNLVTFANLLIDLAYSGLKIRNLNEERFLEPLQQIISTKTNLAQTYLKLFTQLNNDINKFTQAILWK